MSAHPFGKKSEPEGPREPEPWEYGEASPPLWVNLFAWMLTAAIVAAIILAAVM